MLTRITTRRAYYPGAGERRDAFVALHPEAEELGSGPDDALPWTFIRGVPPGRTDDICFNVESFCGELAETALTAPSVGVVRRRRDRLLQRRRLGNPGRHRHREPVLHEGARRR